jgi:prepilin-type N-terminal cleavage/methylation domain-containing protein
VQRQRRHPRGFTLIEILMTMLILGITTVIAVDAVSRADSGLRAERAAREAVAAVRYARSKAIAETTPYKVRFNVAARTISVIDPSNGDAVLSAPLAGNLMQISLTGRSDISGVTMSASLAGDTTDPYDVAFTSIGGTANSGTITFTYGTTTRTLQIPNVGDPTLVGESRKP